MSPRPPKDVLPRPKSRLVLVTPPGPVESWIEALGAALAAGDVASVIVWTEPADQRAALATARAAVPTIQAAGAAALLRGDPQLVARAGFDGLHHDGAPDEIAERVEAHAGERIVGAGNLRSRHDAMTAGEAGADYVLFGNPAPGETRGNALDLLIDRVGWWQPIFEVPCVALAPALDDVEALARAGADFVALGAAAFDDPRGAAAAVRAAQSSLDAAHRVSA